MTRRRKGWRGAAVVFGFSLLALGCAAFARSHYRPAEWSGDRELAQLMAERANLQGSADSVLQAFRNREKAGKGPMRTVGQWEAVVHAASPRWRLEWQPADAGFRKGILTAESPFLREWPVLLDALRHWSKEPGIILESLEITAQGSGRNRKFSRCRVGLRFAVGPEKPPPS